MKLVISIIVLLSLCACGKKIEDRANTSTKNTNTKDRLTRPETWSIRSERPLPNKVKVLINGMEFVNECKGIGNASIFRTERNGTIDIEAYSAFRQEYFDIDIFDCKSGQEFYSQDYVDQTIIDHPRGAPLKIVLRLRN